LVKVGSPSEAQGAAEDVEVDGTIIKVVNLEGKANIKVVVVKESTRMGRICFVGPL
jgi:ribosomal protein L7Ae-like RNA K-turn-binding protein